MLRFSLGELYFVLFFTETYIFRKLTVVSLQYQRKGKCLFLLIKSYTKNVQEIQMHLKQNILVTMWKWLKLKLFKFDDKRNITFIFFLT